MHARTDLLVGVSAPGQSPPPICLPAPNPSPLQQPRVDSRSMPTSYTTVGIYKGTAY